MHQPGEPHVDVILDRIKQVIARDSRPADARTQRSGQFPLSGRTLHAEPEAAFDPVDADEAAEVLELGEDGIVPQSASDAEYGREEHPSAIPLADGDDDGGDDLVAYDWAEPEGLGAAETEPMVERQAEAAPTASSAPLMGAETRAATRERLAALSMLSTLARERQARGLDDLSIEAMTHDLLRPMLAEWLDSNLPAMVERMVQAEIRRIVGEQG